MTDDTAPRGRSQVPGATAARNRATAVPKGWRGAIDPEAAARLWPGWFPAHSSFGNVDRRLANLLARDGAPRCAYCGVTLHRSEPLHHLPPGASAWFGDIEHPAEPCPTGEACHQVDHVVPKARGGRDTLTNTVLACGPCNLAKGSLTASEFMARRSA